MPMRSLPLLAVLPLLLAAPVPAVGAYVGAGMATLTVGTPPFATTCSGETIVATLADEPDPTLQFLEGEGSPCQPPFWEATSVTGAAATGYDHFPSDCDGVRAHVGPLGLATYVSWEDTHPCLLCVCPTYNVTAIVSFAGAGSP